MIRLPASDPQEGTLRDFAPDLTPMLDILFILLVFFMLTAGAVFQSLELNLPSNTTEDSALINEPKHILLEIKPTAYAVDDTPLADFPALTAMLPDYIKSKPDYELIVAGDKTISIQRLLSVLTYLQTQGIKTANILMQSESKK